MKFGHYRYPGISFCFAMALLAQSPSSPAAQPPGVPEQAPVQAQAADAKKDDAIKPDANRYSVVFSGRMFGYFRVPEVQNWTDRGCQAIDPTREPEAGAFQTVMGRAEAAAAQEASRPGTTVRVAVGDNFAPFLVSRKMLRVTDQKQGSQGTGQKPELLDKATYEYNPATDHWTALAENVPGYLSGTGRIATDNVACFISAMGFDALVPGLHDFYYGPERLREIARFLRERPNPTRMLAANLYIQARNVDTGSAGGAQAGSGGAAAGKGSKGAVAAGSDTPKPQLVLPKVALPWLRAITVKNVRRNQPVPAGGSPNAPAALIQEVCLLPLPLNANPKAADPDQSACEKGGLRLKPRLMKEGANLEYWLDPGAEPLSPGRYKVFASGRDGDGTIAAEPATLDVQFPYFEYPADASTTPRLSDLKPWVVRGDGENQRVAIFGVVSSALFQGVGELNSMWFYLDPDGKIDNHREIDVQVSDAAEALKQVFQYCQEDAECSGARKVLLAQMEQQEVFEMSAHIPMPERANPIDVVVAEADADRASGERNLTRTLGPDLTGPKSAKPIVLVPGSHFRADQPYVLAATVQTAEVTPLYEEGAVNKQRVETKVYAAKCAVTAGLFPDKLQFLQGGTEKLESYLRVPPAKPPLPQVADEHYLKFLDQVAFNRRPDGSTQDWKTGIEQVALYAMRTACHADIAMMQHRDVFVPGDSLQQFLTQPLTQPGIEQVVSAIFWKGDLVLCKQLTGDTINSMLRQSKQYQTDEDNGLATDLTTGYSLATLGADDTASDDSKRLIDGQLIDPKRLYSVAISDYLVGGDTGYSMLQGTDQPPLTPLSKTMMRPLTDLVALTVTGRKVPLGRTQPGSDSLDSALLKRDVAGGPSFMQPEKQSQPGFLDWFRHFVFDHRSAAFACAPAKDKIPASTEGCAEEMTQQRPNWWVNLYKADLSYSLFLHGGSETAIAQQFPGVTSVNVASPENNTKAADYILRVEHDSRHFMEYIQSSLNYGYRLQRTVMSSVNSASGVPPNEPYSPSQTADYWYQEAGIGYRLTPPLQSPAGLKLVLATGLQTQAAAPFTQFSVSQYLPPGAAASSGGGSTPAVKASRTIYPSGRLGLRYDFLYPKSKSAASGGGGAGAGAGTPAAASASSGGGGGGGKKGGGGQSSGQPSGGGGQSSGQGQSQTLSSFLEYGYERGNLYHGVSDYLFQPTNPADGSFTRCAVDDYACLTSVALAASKEKGVTVPAGTLASVLSNREHQQHGFYYNFRIDGPLPLISGSEFVLENRGDWFLPHRDLLIDTRLNVDFKVSLIVPVWQKISLSPSVESILFQTQVSHNFYHSLSTSLSLNYSFEWHPGIGLLRSLVYGNPVPTQPALPTK